VRGAGAPRPRYFSDPCVFCLSVLFCEKRNYQEKPTKTMGEKEGRLNKLIENVKLFQQ